MSTSVAAVASSFPTVSFRFIDEWLSVYEGDFARRVLSPYVGLPFIIFIVGASALVVYAFALVIRGCCFKPPARQSKRLSSIAVASVSLTLLGVIVINLGNLGIVAFEKGTLRVTSNVQAVESQLRKASLLLGDIQSSASSLANNDQLGACSLPKALYMPNKTLEVVLRAVSDISSTTVVYASQGLYVINSLLTTLSSLLAPMSQYSSQAILASYIVYGVLFAVFIMFALSVLCKSSGFIKLCVAFGFVFTMFLTILCCMKMIFIPVVGNYCLDTRNNAMEIIKDQRSTGVEAKAFAYLIECPITIAEQDSKILREALNALDKLLSSETLLTQAVLQAKSVFSDAGSDASVADCSYALASTFESVRKLSISVRMLIPGNSLQLDN